MPIKVFKPTSPGRRDMSGQTFEEITHSKPEKSLTVGLRKRAGRNFRILLVKIEKDFFEVANVDNHDIYRKRR